MAIRDGMRLLAVTIKPISTLLFGIPAAAVLFVGTLPLVIGESLSYEYRFVALWSVAILVGIVGFWVWVFYPNPLSIKARIVLTFCIAIGAAAAVIIGLLGGVFTFFAVVALVPDIDALVEIWLPKLGTDKTSRLFLSQTMENLPNCSSSGREEA